MSNALIGKRASVTLDALLDLICRPAEPGRSGPGERLAPALRDLGFLACTPDPDQDACLEHWYARGWDGALDFFLWSRRQYFADRDAAEPARSDAIRHYVRAGGGPVAPRVVPGTPLQLGEPAPLPLDRSLGELAMRRKTVRRYMRKPVPLGLLSGVLWFGLAAMRACRAPIDEKNPSAYLRSYGIAFDVYLVVYETEDLDAGVYAYDVSTHVITRIRPGSFRAEMTRDLFGQAAPETAAWTIVLVADFPRYQWRYRHDRALRHLYVDAGRIGHEALLVAAAYQIGTFMTPAVRDRRASDLLDLDPARQAPIYTLTMGFDPRAHVG